MLEGLSDGEIAAALSDKQVTVTRQAVFAFRKRHAAEITPAVAEVERQITDYAIANKVNRIADLDMLRSMALKELEESGYAWEEQTRYGSKRKVSGAVQALQEADRQAAEELDQLPRGNVNIDNRTQVMLVRSYSGIDPEELG